MHFFIYMRIKKKKKNRQIYKIITVMISNDNHVYIKFKHKKYNNDIIAYFYYGAEFGDKQSMTTRPIVTKSIIAATLSS